MNGILGQAEELARQRNAQYGMLRPEPSLMQRIGGQAKRLFFGDKNMYGNDPLQPSVMDSQYVRPEMAEGAVLDVVGGPMATVWHGSPHRFSKFDMSKIGTGEGAQAYGHGLYFAENPKVAKEYADTGARNSQFDGGSRYVIRKDNLYDDAFDIEQMHQGASAMGGGFESRGSFFDDSFKSKDEALRFLESKGHVPSGSTLGVDDVGNYFVDSRKANLYKVDIPDDQIAKMLDWDKPLSEQAELSKALGNAMGRMKPRQELEAFLNSDFAKSFPNTSEVERAKRMWASGTDEDIADWFAKEKSMQRSSYNLFGNERGSGGYGRLSAMLGGDVQASKALQEQGIPGIKYLDQGSRGAGKGTHNFVVFDDQMPQILEINDKPLKGVLSGQ